MPIVLKIKNNTYPFFLALALKSIIIITLSSCASWNEPLLNDRISHPKREKLDNEEEKIKLSYLAREMMESDVKQQFLANLHDSEIIKKWTVYNTATTFQMGMDIALDQVASGLGLGSAVMVGSFTLEWS